MSDYISKSEALKLIPCEEIAARMVVSQMPTIDAVPVVRCKDCKWWGLSAHNTLGIHICEKFSLVRDGSDYCSRAERSEDEPKR